MPIRKKTLLALTGLLALATTGFAGFVFLARPLSRPPQTISADPTADPLARGEYLAYTTGCIDCHSERDFARYAGPPKAPLGANGGCFDKGVGVPGVVCPPNLTSDKETGLGSWTDGEILRAMREGVSRNGRSLFPLMPYADLKHLSDEDALSIIAYLRTLPAATCTAPAPKLDFPLPIVIRFIPQPLEAPVAAPVKTDTAAYGRYLTSTMGCAFCHTTADTEMTPIPGHESGLGGGVQQVDRRASGHRLRLPEDAEADRPQRGQIPEGPTRLSEDFTNLLLTLERVPGRIMPATWRSLPENLRVLLGSARIRSGTTSE